MLPCEEEATQGCCAEGDLAPSCLPCCHTRELGERGEQICTEIWKLVAAIRANVLRRAWPSARAAIVFCRVPGWLQSFVF